MTEVSMIKATCGGWFIKASDTGKKSQNGSRKYSLKVVALQRQ
jgi:hypothetical protein